MTRRRIAGRGVGAFCTAQRTFVDLGAVVTGGGDHEIVNWRTFDEHPSSADV
jgi:hypothetical protein